MGSTLLFYGILLLFVGAVIEISTVSTHGHGHHPTVLAAAFFQDVAGNRSFLTIANGVQPLGLNTMISNETFNDTFGSLQGKFLVVFTGPDAVGMTFDGQLEVGVLLKKLCETGKLS